MTEPKKFTYDEIFQKLYDLYVRHSINPDVRFKMTNPYNMYQDLRKAFAVGGKE